MCVCVFRFKEWKDGLASPEDLSPESLQPSGFMTALPVDFPALPNTQVCQTLNFNPSYLNFWTFSQMYSWPTCILKNWAILKLS